MFTFRFTVTAARDYFAHQRRTDAAASHPCSYGSGRMVTWIPAPGNTWRYHRLEAKTHHTVLLL